MTVTHPGRLQKPPNNYETHKFSGQMLVNSELVFHISCLINRQKHMTHFYESPYLKNKDYINILRLSGCSKFFMSEIL